MRKITRLTVLTAALLSACSLTSCSFFGEKEPEEQVIVDDTPTPGIAATDTPTPTPVPENQDTTYNSIDKNVTIELPDGTWANKTDDPKMLRFESEGQGKILILHGEGDDLATAIMPDNEDLANTLLMGEGLTQVEDFEILTYSKNNVNGSDVISYLVHYVNTEKSSGKYYTQYKYLKNDSEYYSIAADVYKDDPELLASVQAAVESFRITGESSLKEAAEAPASAGSQESSGGSEQSSSGYTEEQLSDTNQTRTIYRNSDGYPLVITPKDDGNWTDTDGNTYRFTSDQDVYDQNDVDYYYHGEPGNVRFMTYDE